jgi:hypothetical protein
VGICKAGTQTCKPDGSGFGECTGEVTPQVETCASTADEDCNKLDCVKWAELFDCSNVSVDGVAVDPDGNIVVVGTFMGTIPLSSGALTSTGNNNVFVIKLDVAGKPLWGKAFGATGNDAFATAVAVDAMGDIVIGGKAVGAMSFGGAPVDPGIFVAKLSKADGQHVWSRGLTVGYEGASLFDSDYLRALAVTPEGDVLIGGTFSSSIDFGDGVIAGPSANSGYYGYVAKLYRADGSGKSADGGWGRALCSGTSYCDVGGVAVDSMGAVLLAADFHGTLDLSSSSHLTAAGSQDMVLAKLTPSGSPVWQRQLGAAGAMCQVHDLAVDAGGGPVLVGAFKGSIDFGAGNVSASSNMGFIAHYGPDKAHVWSRFFDTDGSGALFATAATAGGGAFLAGRFSTAVSFGSGSPTLTPSGGADVLVAAFSGSGTVAWARGYGGPLDQEATGVALTPQGDPIVVGSAMGPIDFGAGTLEPTSGMGIFVTKLSP